MNLLILFLLSILQNMCFTWSSRSRNSGNIKRHALAATFSNGIWFGVNFFTVFPLIMDSIKEDTMEKYYIFAVYTAGTVIGSCLMMAIALGKIYIPFLSEKGSDEVGARGK